MKRVILAVGFIGLIVLGCSSDDDSTTEVVVDDAIEASSVIENYADLVLANYQVALVDAEAMNVAIQTFVATPTEENFEAAKEAWLTSRESYGPSEAFRFANGPIDTGDTEEIEGYLNSWPLDEAYIDYVEGDVDAGIINNLADFPTLTKEILTGENGNGGEENVAIGYHAIEFLLWGQDLTAPSENLAGQRAYTDFVDGGTAANQDRRREYLAIVADLLTDHLQIIIDEWSGDYRSTFLALDEDEALDNIISSIAELSRSELAIERMAVALQNQDQEDEHSCFSDNTHRDIRLNLAGIVNVYTGAYGSVDGNSLQDLIEEADTDLATELDALLATAVTDVDATLDPFDLAIVDGESSVEGAKVQTAVQALVAFGDKLLEAKVALGIN
ncbi:putative iron-regulated protein [Maribacter dokdonensis]|uniref:Putative iron-regulated protein n=1 Tax=Maribacter dokdonensis TaxID=320912 RepID=A0A1H4KMB2_9FLAO|nr:imelysin family protein [Maribacter dokdonensis]SEB59719.1 putative iron-regulated protein [Maribacter dokdonensis]